MNRYHFIIFLCLLSFNVKASVIEKWVSLQTPTGKLAGTLLMAEPKNNTKQVALIIAGSGPTDRDGNSPQMKNNALKMLANELAQAGISSLRYDKRGVGESALAGIEERVLRFEHYIDDAQGWISLLKQLNEFKDIVVIGHSEGSLIGMIAAERAKADKFISIAGVGRPIDQVIRTQLKSQSETVLNQANPILNQLMNGETVADVPSYLNALFRSSVQPYMISWFKYDPRIELSKLLIPVQIIQGDTDIQVALSEAAQLAGANEKAKKIVIKGMNHVLKSAPIEQTANLATYYQADLPIKPELVKHVTEFIISGT